MDALLTLSISGAGRDQRAEGLGGRQPHHPAARGDSRRLPEAEAKGPAGRGGGPCVRGTGGYLVHACVCVHLCVSACVPPA